MFSDREILLSILLERSAGGGENCQLVRDCALSHIAKIPSRVNRRVVPCLREVHLVEAIAADGVVGVIVPKGLATAVPPNIGLAVTHNPIALANRLHETLCEDTSFHWDSFESIIDETASIHPAAVVATNDVVIGAHSTVHAGAIIMPRSLIGKYCTIGPGTVVGADAFEIDSSVSPRKILPQAGGVKIDDYVELQASCTIVRSTFGGFTIIGRESKFDCQVHLAHDCQVGMRVTVAACAEISGRVSIGDDAFIGPNSSVSNGIIIGDGAHVTLGAVVVKDVEEGARVSGNFAVEHAKLIAHIKAIR